MIKSLKVTLLLLGAVAAQEIFNTADETQEWRRRSARKVVGGIRLGFLNDIHHEPDYDTMVVDKIASKKKKLKLVQ